MLKPALLAPALLLLAAPAEAAMSQPPGIQDGPITTTVNTSPGGGFTAVWTSETTINGTSTTGDVLRFLTKGGALTGANAIVGFVAVNAIDTGNGANGFAATYQLMTNGNGISQAAITPIGSAVIRGTSPVASIQIAADGVGPVKITLTTAAATVTGAIVRVSFMGLIKQ